MGFICRRHPPTGGASHGLRVGRSTNSRWWRRRPSDRNAWGWDDAPGSRGWPAAHVGCWSVRTSGDGPSERIRPGGTRRERVTRATQGPNHGRGHNDTDNAAGTVSKRRRPHHRLCSEVTHSTRGSRGTGRGNQSVSSVTRRSPGSSDGCSATTRIACGRVWNVRPPPG